MASAGPRWGPALCLVPREGLARAREGAQRRPMNASLLILGDTIAAIASGLGEAGLAVLRVSGPDAIAIADRVFAGRSPLQSAPSHTLHHGWAVWPVTGAVAATGPEGPGDGAPDGARPGERLDEVVAGLFRAPRSYTRE